MEAIRRKQKQQLALSSPTADKKNGATGIDQVFIIVIVFFLIFFFEIINKIVSGSGGELKKPTLTKKEIQLFEQCRQLVNIF